MIKAIYCIFVQIVVFYNKIATMNFFNVLGWVCKCVCVSSVAISYYKMCTTRNLFQILCKDGLMMGYWPKLVANKLNNKTLLWWSSGVCSHGLSSYLITFKPHHYFKFAPLPHTRFWGKKKKWMLVAHKMFTILAWRHFHWW